MNTLHSEGLSNGAMGRLKGDRSNTSSEKNYSLAGQLMRGQKDRTPLRTGIGKITCDANAPEAGANDLRQLYVALPFPRPLSIKHLADL